MPSRSHRPCERRLIAAVTDQDRATRAQTCRQRTGHSGNRCLAGENRGLAAVQDKRVKPCEAACQTPDLCHRGRRGEHRTCLRLCLADRLQHGSGKFASMTSGPSPMMPSSTMSGVTSS